MASRVYLTNRTAPYTPATIRGTWNDTAGAVTRALDTEKDYGGASTTVARAETVTTNPYDVLLYRGVSGPLAAQTISGTLDVAIGILESNAAADFNWHLHVYVTQGDSDTPRGTLLSDYVESAGVNEWPTSGTIKALAAAQTLSGLAISAGDRIVAELGVRARNAVTTSYTATLRYGCADSSGVGLTDAVVGNASSTTVAMYMDFSATLVEAVQAVQARVTQLFVESVALQAPASEVRVTQVFVETAAPAVGGFNALLVSP